MNISEDEQNERDPQFDDFPSIPRGLIEALECRMPERWPNPEMPDRDIWVRAGQLKVLEYIRSVFDKQQSQSAEGTINVHR